MKIITCLPTEHLGVLMNSFLPYDLKNYADLLLSSSICITVNDLIDTRDVY